MIITCKDHLIDVEDQFSNGELTVNQIAEASEHIEIKAMILQTSTDGYPIAYDKWENPYYDMNKGKSEEEKWQDEEGNWIKLTII